jgi:hypothetical protein
MATISRKTISKNASGSAAAHNDEIKIAGLRHRN